MAKMLTYLIGSSCYANINYINHSHEKFGIQTIRQLAKKEKKMKKTSLVLGVMLLMMLLTNSVWAQVPGIINYQARLTNSAGEPLTGDHSFDFAIVDQSGYALWQTTSSIIISVQDGLYSVQLGGAGMQPIDSYMFQENTDLWLRVTVDGEQLSPNNQLTSVAFAQKAHYAEYSESADYSNASLGSFWVSDNLSVGGYIDCSSYMNVSGGIYTGGYLGAITFIEAGGDITSTDGDIIAINGDITAGGVKNFVIDHPLDNDKKIVYACMEGPEAAVYNRGTVDLVNGEAWIAFEEHFELVISPETITVQVSPLSTESKGLAVIEKTAEGFRVKELNKGTGNYKFDYFVQGIRKGYEDYRVIRDKSEYESDNNSKIMESKLRNEE